MKDLILRNMAFKLVTSALVIVCVLRIVENAGKCPPIGYFWWSYDAVLEGHVVERHDHLPEEKCQAQCIKNPKCYSLNHKNDFSEGNCEINDATREMFPENYRERKGWVYCAIKESFCLSFPKRSLTNLGYDYVILRNAITIPLSAVTVCLWMKSSDKSHCGTPFSYSAMARGGDDDEIEIFNYQNLDFYISGESKLIDIPANDGQWHHICGTWDNGNGSWAFYKDGHTQKQGNNLRTNKTITEGGVLVLGVEQDRDGGGFAFHQSFAGEMTTVNVWSRALSSQEISRMSRSLRSR